MGEINIIAPKGRNYFKRFNNAKIIRKEIEAYLGKKVNAVMITQNKISVQFDELPKKSKRDKVLNIIKSVRSD